eukprot:TRINITY_DN6179_c3_g1_i1.p1 TRINITY_DN6179_c3_g1~~TRINITY_DN6179_c3_g1_i1.p1  ORF type:complete len:861 (-),score=287.96 TRINITY_DN6179_c3_g1_i1:33-2615(-)
MSRRPDQSVVRIKPLHYIHVHNNNTNVSRVEIGPQTFTKQDHESVVLEPTKMVMIPPRHFCTIKNPVILRDNSSSSSSSTTTTTTTTKTPLYDQYGNYRFKFGDKEIRFEQEPFPLYPTEVLVGAISPLRVVETNTALRILCERDFVDAVNGMNVPRKAGEEWLFRGPSTYIPRVEVEVRDTVHAIIIKENEALRIRASRAFTDTAGRKRIAGEEWIERDSGAFLPEVEMTVVDQVRAYVLTEKRALHLRATQTYTDVFGNKRKAGEEWLVTQVECDTHIPMVEEMVVGEVSVTTLNNRQYCVVLNSVDATTGKPRFGKRELRQGDQSFFLLPFEALECGIQNVEVLGEEEALLLSASESFIDGTGTTAKTRSPGDTWMIYGPRDYIPSVEVNILERRRTIPLDESEGIYVRDIRTGQVRAVTGQSYMLQQNEKLWEKDLPRTVEDLVARKIDSRVASRSKSSQEEGVRDRTRVVTYRAPHNSAVQIYDYKKKRSRIVFGPTLVMLGPDEHFTLLSLSGDKPKRPDRIKSLCLLLGPDFMTDVVSVETADHARLDLQLAYNWYFDVNESSPSEHKESLFAVSDFVGDACKALASRVRASVAATRFEIFHTSSAEIIRQAVFGTKGRTELRFGANHLVVTGVDIQAVEPTDQRTRESLQKSVQLAIEITTMSQEAKARHEAQCKDQQARGQLERAKIVDESQAEKERKSLLQLQALSAAVESTGQATAEAKARAEAELIEGRAAVQQAKHKAEALKITSEADLDLLTRRNMATLAHEKALSDLEVSKAREVARIETDKFTRAVDAMGSETIKDMACAGPEMQARLLEGLGLQSCMITDGNSPINLFTTANGMMGGLPTTQQ